ncbi:HBS1 isoform X1 isoform B [Micractinium conductrix]|uniref:HBS1 isoform X1 isoform B n=1 Tax=Micractinium conductrix TaxID=554055 RepID=A0A2P6VA03_9CHLO|nr:HBS1 isoform X1 isoform B [Micractinium conductrix]|eukprot:PSC70924.1 HBS1 isoform X1 isoform B [Micractinium conductrix]
MAPKNKYYDDDDLDDYEDDDYWDEEGEEEPAPQPPPKPKPAPKSAATPAAAAAKKLPQAAAIKQQPQRLVPEAATAAAAAAGVHAYAFDQPSPDDAVLAAQQKKGGGAPAAAPVAAPKPAYNPLQHQRQAAAAAVLAGGMQGLSVGSQQQQRQQAQPPDQQQRQADGGPSAAAASAAAAAKPPLQRRPLSEYAPHPELAAACAAAAAAEAAGDGKPRLHLVVLGHVDAGKSTLMGRTLYELGLISDKVVHKTQHEAAATGKGSFAWAWMLDERPEERARGVTVDVAVTRFETPARNVTLLDAPGHRDFVPNMIAGAAQADAALLIVDGSTGGFEAGFEPAAPGSAAGGGQTREHAQLARSLGVEQVAVVVTKLDTCDFDQQRFEAIKAQLEPFLKTCGFRPSAIQWLPAVGPTGENLVKPPADAALAAWWKGPTLAQAIDNFAPTQRLLERPLRLPVSDVLRAGKAGVTVGGKLEGGALRPGSKVLVMPSGQPATVKSLEVDGKPASLARAGDSADVTLAGIDTSAVGAGSVVCHPDFPVPLVSKFEARVVVLEVPIPLLRGQQVTIHAHTARESGHVSALLSLLNSKTGEVQRAKPRCLLKGQSAVVEVTPARPLCLEEYSAYKALGRVALRDGGRTIAVGIITGLPAEGSGAA